MASSPHSVTAKSGKGGIEGGAWSSTNVLTSNRTVCCLWVSWYMQGTLNWLVWACDVQIASLFCFGMCMF